MSGQTPFDPYSQPVPGQFPGGPRPNIPNHLVKAIISTVCCGCPPLGIVAIVFAAQVNGKIDAGDYAGAQKASDQASMWGNIAIALGVIGGIIGIAIQVLAFMAQQGR